MADNSEEVVARDERCIGAQAFGQQASVGILALASEKPRQRQVPPHALTIEGGIVCLAFFVDRIVLTRARGVEAIGRWSADGKLLILALTGLAQCGVGPIACYLNDRVCIIFN